ncbi:MAG: hypothetical protein KC620_21795, partial [Myxococcales bacterium]|nr:hypothetical protein [Myxococcales bacterium]
MRRTAIALAALLLLIGCDDPAPAKPESCRDDTDCPGTQRCADRVCVPARACDAGLGCCALEACQGGVCAPAPTDDCAQSGCLDPDRECQGDYCVQRACADDADCAGGRCLAGLCLRETPCAGACTEDQACYAHRGLCRRAPPQCAQSCAAGEVRIVLEPDRFNGPQCALDQA